MSKIITDKRGSFIVMSSHHLWDKDLTYRAKGLLCFILALPEHWKINEAGLIAYAGKDGKAAVRSAIKELIDKGYLARHQTRREDGRLGEMEYVIRQNPHTDSDEDFESPTEEEPFSDEPCSDITPADSKPPIELPASNPPLSNIIKSKYYNNKYYKSKDRLIDNARARESECVSQCGKVENSEIQHLYYHRVIANNIGYDALQSEFRDSREELDELVELMVDVLTADPDSTTYIAGQEMRTSVVQSRFLKLQQVHLEQVLLSLSKTTKQVTNMRSYLLTCLYQSFVTAHNEIRQEVNAANFA